MMPHVDVEIGGRTFEVACQDGEEPYLRAAAAMLDTEAQVLLAQTGRVPEARMLLMAGLMLADRTAGVDDQLREASDRMAALQARIDELEARPDPEPERIEVEVMPAGLEEAMAALADEAEAVAGALEDARGGAA
ncbi:cell division protein ZapA [Wenxinia saemankumensis]|uniref:Cell division protein ZapA n=2 Tax=Wenxinia saemankumensis TaxID=1447782 RepID=A0A1M6D232_9RHOB|nr:cell division protein ZapA [Wenxinia saemankumensis]